MSEIALFPTTSHLLPDGHVELLLCEERHLRMLKQSLAGERGFAVCMLNEPMSIVRSRKFPQLRHNAKSSTLTHSKAACSPFR